MSQPKIKLPILPIPFRPNGNTVLVKILEVEEKSQSGKIVIVEPDNGSKKTVRAEIVALGTVLNAPLSNYGDSGEPLHPRIGDMIMIHRLNGNEILLAGQSFRTVRNEDIIGYYE